MAPGRKVFINYRRDDSRADAGRLYDRLQARYRDRVFRDVGSLEPGVEWHVAIERVLSASDACIVVVGPRWLSITDANGKRRLDDPNDTVRQEVATALANGMRVFPVLVGGAKMPSEDELPEEMKSLARRHALEITEQDFDEDVEKLARALDRTLGWAPTPAPGTSSRMGIVAAAVAAMVVVAVGVAAYFVVRNTGRSAELDTHSQSVVPDTGRSTPVNPPPVREKTAPDNSRATVQPAPAPAPTPPPKRDVQIVGAWRALVNSNGQVLDEEVEVYPDSSFRVMLSDKVAAVGTWRRAADGGIDVTRAVSFLANNARFSCRYQPENDVLQGSCVDQLQNRWSVSLSNAHALPDVATELPSVDLSGSSLAERAAFIQLLSSEPCTCGCRLNMHTCLMKDRTCPLSPGLARSQWAAFLQLVRA